MSRHPWRMRQPIKFEQPVARQYLGNCNELRHLFNLSLSPSITPSCTEEHCILIYNKHLLYMLEKLYDSVAFTLQ